MSRLEDLKRELAHLQADHQRRCDTVGKLLEAAMDAAHVLGIVVVVDTTPDQPLAMGNYRTRGHVRMARGLYQEVMRLEREISVEIENSRSHITAQAAADPQRQAAEDLQRGDYDFP